MLINFKQLRQLAPQWYTTHQTLGNHMPHLSLSLSLSLSPSLSPSPSLTLSQVISGLFYNTVLMLELLEKTHFPDSPEPITAQFFTQWVKDATADLYTG